MQDKESLHNRTASTVAITTLAIAAAASIAAVTAVTATAAVTSTTTTAAVTTIAVCKRSQYERFKQQALTATPTMMTLAVTHHSSAQHAAVYTAFTAVAVRPDAGVTTGGAAVVLVRFVRSLSGRRKSCYRAVMIQTRL